MFRIIVLLIILMMQSSCAVVPAPPLPRVKPLSWQQQAAQLQHHHDWYCDGTILVRMPMVRFSTRFKWQQHAKSYEIKFSQANSTAMRLVNDHGCVRLFDEKRHSSLATLAQFYEWHLPFKYLKYWIRALIIPNATANTQFSQYDRLQQLVQKNWMIRYDDYQLWQGYYLPRQILLTNYNLRINITILHWKIEP